LAKAYFNDQLIADSTNTVKLEGNHYFPWAAVNKELLQPNTKTTVCPWKGTASYYDVVVDGQVATAAAWEYKSPSDRAAVITGHVAFYGDVTVTD